MALGPSRSRVQLREGAHGVVYASGAVSGGRVGPHEALQGRRIRGIFGGRGQFVAIVDAWALDWQQSRDRGQVLGQEIATLGLNGAVRVQQVAFGAQHRVALSLDGHLYSWGRRDASLATGELGQVASGWHSVTLTPRGADGSAVAATPALDPKTDSVTPESDASNQFEDREEPIDNVSSVCHPRRVHTPSDLFFTKVSCGSHHSVALTDRGDLYAWGRNFEGQLGLGSSSLPTTVDRLRNGMCAWPKFVGALLGKPRCVDVACGDRFTVALLADGSLWRWGERTAGITGREDEKMERKPRRLVASGLDGPSFSGLAAGAAHALAVTANGDVYAWGLNAHGQLGLGSDRRQSCDSPRLVPRPDGVVWTKVCAGGSYSAALAADGQLFTWGNGHHGQLGHATRECEFAPRAVDALRGVSVSSVVCDSQNLFAFAPTVVASISPSAGEISGGYELRIGGGGFWDSEDLTVRFAPLTEGRLPRGALARLDPATREIVCQVPKFSLPGEFTVEVATDGKHFTTDGHVFEAFKRPAVMEVSRWEARLAGGEDIEVTIEGAIPRSCCEPLLGLVRDGDQNQRIQVVGTVELPNCDLSTARALSPRENDDADAEVSKTRLLFVTPAFDLSSVVRCQLELSFNGGAQFAPIEIDSPSTSQKTPFVLQFHDARVARCRPNSFLARALPTIIDVEISHLLSPSETWSELAISLQVTNLNVSDATAESRVDVALPITNVQTSVETQTALVTCSVPPLADWKLSKLDAKTRERVEIVTDWWKFVPRWGFEAAVRVSMNGGRDLLPSRSPDSTTSLFGVFSTGKQATASPSTTPLSGGTAVSVTADFFHFDTQDAVVQLKWRDREVKVTNCTISADAAEMDRPQATAVRRLVFTTPALPFPPPPPPPEEEALQSADGSVPTPADDALALSEDVDVFVSLDGRHFPREPSLRLVYTEPADQGETP